MLPDADVELDGPGVGAWLRRGGVGPSDQRDRQQEGGDHRAHSCGATSHRAVLPGESPHSAASGGGVPLLAARQEDSRIARSH